MIRVYFVWMLLELIVLFMIKKIDYYLDKYNKYNYDEFHNFKSKNNKFKFE